VNLEWIDKGLARYVRNQKLDLFVDVALGFALLALIVSLCVLIYVAAKL
jgi:hypothetical protein